jgi:uncharacterized membrane protein
MAVVTDALTNPGLRSVSASLDIESPPEEAFALLCSVEKWPVWLSFLRSAKLVDAQLALGSEVLIRSSIPGEAESLYEIDAYIANYHLSLVGAFSVRRRLDFRIERKTTRSKLHVKLMYPSYGGRFGAMFDRWRNGRKLCTALDDALVHFKGLVEYRRDDGLLGDL